MLTATRKTYQVDYDLRKPNRSYEALHERLRQLGAVRVLFSTWILGSTASAQAVFQDLARFIDNDDGLLVTGLTGEAWWTNLMVSHDDARKAFAA